ncbi:MAG: hypothetical protein R6W90_06350 [Ignavibacteriaceae bacterium]
MNLSGFKTDIKSWVVSADMGYGHQRAVYPFRHIAEEGLIVVGSNETTSKNEKKLWKRVLGVYEFISRAKSIPLIGNPLFTLLDTFLHIPSFYPIRNLSNTTFQVNLLESSIRKGLCSGMIEKVRTKKLPLLTSFYASAIAADKNDVNKTYCIICDADLNRVWVAREPWESSIEYFAPCGKAAQRLKAYGVPDDRIFLTGFPLPDELIGGKDLTTLKSDLGQRLFYLDPGQKFRARHERDVKYFLGRENCGFRNERKLTITYSVGGAGAQKEIGGKIANSLKKMLLNDEVILNLVAGTKKNVNDYFIEVKKEISESCNNIRIIYADSIQDYFKEFTQVLRTTDILWTKPSELSFYCALGIPIVMTPAIGSQEKFNRQWLYEIHAGIRQENPEFTHQWLFDLLRKGTLAELAWSGFLKARKLGTYKILEVLETAKMTNEKSPVIR